MGQWVNVVFEFMSCNRVLIGRRPYHSGAHLMVWWRVYRQLLACWDRVSLQHDVSGKGSSEPIIFNMIIWVTSFPRSQHWTRNVFILIKHSMFHELCAQFALCCIFSRALFRVSVSITQYYPYLSQLFPGGWFNIDMSYQYRNSHYKDETVSRPSVSSL